MGRMATCKLSCLMTFTEPHLTFLCRHRAQPGEEGTEPEGDEPEGGEPIVVVVEGVQVVDPAVEATPEVLQAREIRPL
jgi:hypothetical protein